MAELGLGVKGGGLGGEMHGLTWGLGERQGPKNCYPGFCMAGAHTGKV